MKKSLTPNLFEGDDKIVEKFWQRNPDAIQETDSKYGRILQSIAYNILFDLQDCEECQNDAYLKIWNTIPSTRPKAFFSYLMQIMRQISIDRYREKTRKKRIPSQLTVSLEELELIGGGISMEEMYEAKEIGKMISEYIRGLNDRQQYIFLDHYYTAEPVEKTAAELKISVQTVYREIEKIKQDLRKYLERNGVSV